jgi:glycosyltransferase involved in cell wall biosynthesis
MIDWMRSDRAPGTYRRSGETSIRLALVIPSLKAGIRYHAPMVDALSRRGLEILVFTGIPPREPSPFPLEVVKGRVLRDRIDEEGYAKPFMHTSPRLIVELLRWRPEVIITVEYGLATLWSIIAGLAGRCPVAILQEHISPAAYRDSPARRVFRLALAQFADAFIANTKEAAAEIVSTLRVPPARIFEVPLLLPPTCDYLLADPFESPQIARRPVFLFVGRLIGRKNPRVLLEAAHLLHQQGQRFAVWIAGEGPERAALGRYVESNDLEDVVSFLGPIPYRSIGHAYQASDVFVMPTLADVMSVAVLEAIRFERPVIGSKMGGFAGHAVLEGVNGFLFDPRDAAGLARCMSSFIDEPALIDDMGRRSAEILHGLSHEDSADRLVRVLRSLLRRKRGRDGGRSEM